MKTLGVNNHSAFALHYQLVLVIKYRRKVADGKISIRLREMYENMKARYNISLLEWNHDKVHIHIQFKADPNTEISKFINAYKSVSNWLIKKEFLEIKNDL